MNQKQQDAEGVGGVTAVVADLAVTLASGSVPVSCSRKNRTERPWASQQPYPSGCSLVVVFQKKSAQRFSGHHMVSPPAPSGPSELNAADIDIAASRRRPWWTPCSPSCERMCVLECSEHSVANVGAYMKWSASCAGEVGGSTPRWPNDHPEISESRPRQCIPAAGSGLTPPATTRAWVR